MSEGEWVKAEEQPHAEENKFLWLLLRGKKVLQNFWVIMPPQVDEPVTEEW